jgi:hypothetical protein
MAVMRDSHKLLLTPYREFEQEQEEEEEEEQQQQQQSKK